MSVGAILTQGLGQFGGVNLLPTLGYVPSLVPVVTKQGGDDAPGFSLKAWKRARKLDEDMQATIERLLHGETAPAVVEAVQQFERKQINPAKLARALARIEKRYEPIEEEDEMEELLLHLQ